MTRSECAAWVRGDRFMGALLGALLFSAAASADVILVPQDYINIQVAVNNAGDGDVILIAPDNIYLGPVDIGDKTLTLIVDGGTARVPQIKIHDLSAGKTVVLRGLGGDGQYFSQFGPKGEGLRIENNAGHVRVQGAIFVGGNGINTLNHPLYHPAGYDAVIVKNSASVVLSHCAMTGGLGATVNDEDFQGSAGRGGAGLYAENSDVSVDHSALTGLNGGSINDTLSYDGGDGGDGARVIGGWLYVAASTFKGGNAGSADCKLDIPSGTQICGDGGDGGIDAGSSLTEVWHHGNVATAGFAGSAGGPGGQPGTPGVALEIKGAAVQTLFEDAPRDFSVGSPVREGQLDQLDFTGLPGDSAFVWASIAPRWELLPAYQGVFLIDNGPVFNLFLALGPTDGAGALSVPFLAPDLGPFEALTFQLQGIVQTAGGKYLLAPASTLVLLDSSF